MNAQTSPVLFQNRNRTVAKSFYRELKGQGFSHEQIIDLLASVLDLVSEDIKVYHRA